MGKNVHKGNICAHIKEMNSGAFSNSGTLFLVSFPVETTWELFLVSQYVHWKVILNG